MKFPPGYVPGIGVPKPITSRFGERMLQSMGWEHGQGLGLNKNGITEAIQVKQKDDNAGVGANNAWNWAEKQWEDVFNSAVQAIDHDNGSSGSSSSSSSASEDDASSSGYSSDDSDSDASHGQAARRSATSTSAPGGAAGGGVAPRLNRDGTVASGNADELAIASELARDPWGRFGGRDGKMARIRAQEAALMAKLGLAPPTAPDAAAAPAAGVPGEAATAATAGCKKKKEAKRRRVSGCDAAAGTSSSGELQEKTAGRKRRQQSDLEEEGSGDQGKKKRRATNKDGAEQQPLQLEAAEGSNKKKKKKKDNKKGKLQDVTNQAPSPTAAAGPAEEGEDEDQPPPVCSYPPDWWGARLFAFGGVLGSGLSVQVSEAARQRKEFSEGDQEALYMAAHGGKSQGKRGLGKGAGGKLLGSDWSGKKVLFGDDGAEGGGSGGQQKGKAVAAARTPSSCEQKEKEGGVKVLAAAAEAGALPPLPGVKWKKLIAATMAESGTRRLKLRTLAAAVLTALHDGGHLTAGQRVDKKQLRSLLEAKVQASARLRLDGRVVVRV